MAYSNLAFKPPELSRTEKAEEDPGAEAEPAEAPVDGDHEDKKIPYSNLGSSPEAARAELFSGQFDGPPVAPAPAPAAAAEKKKKKEKKYIKGAKTSLEGEGKYEKLAPGKWKDTGETVSKEESGVHGHRAALHKEFEHEEEGKSDAFGTQKTHYMNAEELQQHSVKASGEKDEKYLSDQDGKAIDSKGARPGLKDAKEDRLIYAMKDGQMAQADAGGDMKKMKEEYKKGERPSADREHHSSFFKGEAVEAAGDMKVENGDVKRISNHSGHYEPSAPTLVQAVQHLDDMGINTNNTIAELAGTGTQCAVPELKQAGGKEKLLAQKHKKVLPAIEAFDKSQLKAPKPSDEATEGTTRAEAERAALRG